MYIRAVSYRTGGRDSGHNVKVQPESSAIARKYARKRQDECWNDSDVSRQALNANAPTSIHD